MSTTSLVINASQTGTAYTSDLNDALAAINTCHSGTTAPTDDVSDGKFWLDTSGANPVLKIYRSGWKTLFTLKASAVDVDYGAVTSTSHTSTGAISGASVTGTGAVSGNTLVATTSVSGASGSFSGTVTAADFNTTSDARLKSDIQTLEESLAKVMMMRGVSYVMGGSENVGLIAQEVEEIVPEVVSVRADGYKGVSYGNLVPVLIEAIKEQQSQIEDLKGRLEKLEK